MASKRINITLPQDELANLDLTVKADHTTRSAYIREAITLKQQLETSIEDETTDKDSMTHIVLALHARRMAKKRIRSTSPLTYSQLQD